MARIGVTGMGTMGAALALNIADRGYDVVVQNRTTSKAEATAERARTEGTDGTVTTAEGLGGLVDALETPRTIVVMVPAGDPAEAVIDALTPLLAEADILIDGGNADFHDTRRRAHAAEEAGLRYLGMGVSGGEDGARHGPSIMVGGSAGAWDDVGEVIEAIAARYKDSPCAAYLGADGAGHFVKTVHNGIEYADMELIAEAYGILRDMGDRTPEDMAALFRSWNQGPLNSYLIEITGEVLAVEDDGRPLVELIQDRAGQKGTGRWTMIEAARLGQAANTIEAAVGARVYSAQKATRERASELLGPAGAARHSVLDGDLEEALLAGRIIAYSQGMSLLTAASAEYDWNLDLARVAEIWRAGCIIRSGLLDDIAAAVREGMPADILILSPRVLERLEDRVTCLRRVVGAAMAAGQPVPAMAAALGYYDSLRQSRGTANLIQGLRDRFGRHGFERTDRGGTNLHGPWAD